MRPKGRMLSIFSVVDVNRAYPHVWVEGIFVEQDSAASKVGDAKTVCGVFVLQIFDRFLQSNNVPFPAICLSMAPCVPRLGPGFHVKMLMHVCASCR